eukprot:CAMPEP_0117671896 /NCGR_PEP_ID=MMETSP0804-20121206/13603_1 /TAXON_ID=1074897 /ORGANISM="Tetraselmis astigmatica, Strain CCMP880" /LENGTH=514 /DNA_ID=CAMNT_0005480437 /DNA_START=116 /DNA_END=1660 /DNA_ORIENTATION=-
MPLPVPCPRTAVALGSHLRIDTIGTRGVSVRARALRVPAAPGPGSRRSSPRRRRHLICQAKRLGDDDYDEDEVEEEEDDGEEELQQWMAEIDAEEVDMDEEDVREVPFHEELGDANLVPYGQEEVVLQPPRFDPDPRMRIMTKDGSRWDEDGVDRLKFLKAIYEVPEVHQTPEMREMCRQVDEEERVKEWGDKASQRDVDAIRERLQLPTDLMGEEAWDILADYLPTEEEQKDEERRMYRKQRLEDENLEIEERRALKKEEDAYKKKQLMNRLHDDYLEKSFDDETGEWLLSNSAIVKRWRQLRSGFRDDPEYAETMQVAGDNFEHQVNIPDPLVPTPIKVEEVLTQWEMRAQYEAKKQKERISDAYWKDFEERVGTAKEYNCTAENDVRLKPLNGKKQKEWSEEAIMNLITNNGVNADPEEVYRDSLTIMNPQAPCDHINDYGLTYIPSIEESIAEMGLFMPRENIKYTSQGATVKSVEFALEDGGGANGAEMAERMEDDMDMEPEGGAGEDR